MEKQKRKSRPSWACKGSALKHRMTSMEKDVFLHAEDGVGGILGGAHNPNINQQNGGVKKEQPAMNLSREKGEKGE